MIEEYINLQGKNMPNSFEQKSINQCRLINELPKDGFPCNLLRKLQRSQIV